MNTLNPAKSPATVIAGGDHYQLVTFERVITSRGSYGDDDESEIFTKIYVIVDRDLLLLAIEAARQSGKDFVVTSVKALDAALLCPVKGVKLG